MLVLSPIYKYQCFVFVSLKILLTYFTKNTKQLTAWKPSKSIVHKLQTENLISSNRSGLYCFPDRCLLFPVICNLWSKSCFVSISNLYLLLWKTNRLLGNLYVTFSGNELYHCNNMVNFGVKIYISKNDTPNICKHSLNR